MKQPTLKPETVENREPAIADGPLQRRASFVLELLRIRLGFWQTIFGAIITGGVAVAIPAGVDTLKTLAENETLQIQAHNEFVSQFLSTAISQDIELRLRFADYFAHVAPSSTVEGWRGYYRDLNERREAIRLSIESAESELALLQATGAPSIEEQLRMASLLRKLNWDIAEVGYAKSDTNISVPTSSRRLTTAEMVAEANVVFDSAHVDPLKTSQADAAVDRIVARRSRYQVVQIRTKIPWYVVGILHQLESGGNFEQVMYTPP